MSSPGLVYFKDRYPDYHWEPLAHRSEKSIRSVYRLIKDGKPALYIKIYDPHSLVQKAINRLRPRTLYEARILKRLQGAGIRVPEVQAHLTCGGATALVTEAIEPARPLWELDPASQAAVLTDMAEALLNKRFSYSDLHVGNVLMDDAGRAVLIDVYEVRPLARVRTRHVVELLSQVDGVFDLSQQDLAVAIGRVSGSWDPARLVSRIKALSAKERALRVGRWIRRSLRPGSFSRQERTSMYTAMVNRRYDIDIPDLMARIELANLTLNQACRTEVITHGAQTYAVQSFPRAGWFSKPLAVQAWKGLLTLFFNAIPCVEPVAVVVRKDRRSVLITTSTADLPDLEGLLRQGLGRMDYAEKCRLATALGGAIARLHAKNIRCSALSSAHIKVAEGPLRFIFLPLDYVQERSCLSQTQRWAALAHLARSLPVELSSQLGLRFIKAYAAVTGDDPRQVMQGCAAVPGGARR